MSTTHHHGVLSTLAACGQTNEAGHLIAPLIPFLGIEQALHAGAKMPPYAKPGDEVCPTCRAVANEQMEAQA